MLILLPSLGYDQVLREDRQVNRLIESLNLFEDVANSPYFGKAALILFLNKTDLFREKIKRGVDLRYTVRSSWHSL